MFPKFNNIFILLLFLHTKISLLQQLSIYATPSCILIRITCKTNIFCTLYYFILVNCFNCKHTFLNSLNFLFFLFYKFFSVT